MSIARSVFVTGNTNKLKEVRAILAAGTSGIDVTNQAVDGEQSLPVDRSATHLTVYLAVSRLTVPEVQGTTQEVAIAKCKAAAKHVSDYTLTPYFLIPRRSNLTPSYPPARYRLRHGRYSSLL